MKHRSGTRALGRALLGAALVTSAAFPASGFKPNDPQGHKDIVRDALRGQTFVTRDGVSIVFDESVIEAIAQADADVDRGLFSMVIGMCDLRTQEFCNPAAHCDDERLPDCSTRIASIRDGLIALRAPVDVARARREFGRALHTLQDFYAHSNWVNTPGPGRTVIHPQLGSSALAPAPAGTTCDPTGAVLRGSGLEQVTSGYFSIEIGFVQPAGKCLHGRPLPTRQPGIAKDEPDRPMFREARDLAVLHTRDFVRSIFSEWDENRAGFTRKIAAPQPALGLAVDATGSMGSELAALGDAAPALFAAAQLAGSAPPALLAPEAKTASAAAAPARGESLERALEAFARTAAADVSASPEPRLLQALAAAAEASPLFFYTDRCDPLSGELSAAADAARTRQSAVHVIFTQNCPAAEGPYRRLAAASGGQVLRISEPQVAASAEWLHAALGRDRQLLLQVRGSFEGGQRMLELPIDATVRELSVSVSAEALEQLEALDPSGAPVRIGGDAVTLTRLSQNALLRVREPAPGRWTLRIRGAGALDVAVSAQSPIAFGRFELLEEQAGRHAGNLFPIEGPARAGSGTAEAALYGPAAAVEFELRALDGSTIRDFALPEGSAEYSRNRFLGPLELPAGTFQVYARGLDSSGHPFVRALPREIRTLPTAQPGAGRAR